MWWMRVVVQKLHTGVISTQYVGPFQAVRSRKTPGYSVHGRHGLAAYTRGQQGHRVHRTSGVVCCTSVPLRLSLSTKRLCPQCTQHQPTSLFRQWLGCITPALAEYAVSAPAVEYIAPAPTVYAAPVEYIAPAPGAHLQCLTLLQVQSWSTGTSRVICFTAPVVEYIVPASAVSCCSPAPIVECMAPATAMSYGSQASVVEYIALA